MFVLLKRINFSCTLCTSTYIQIIDTLITNDSESPFPEVLHNDVSLV